jgi:hypothetical protein
VAAFRLATVPFFAFLAWQLLNAVGALALLCAPAAEEAHRWAALSGNWGLKLTLVTRQNYPPGSNSARSVDLPGPVTIITFDETVRGLL